MVASDESTPFTVRPSNVLLMLSLFLRLHASMSKLTLSKPFVRQKCKMLLSDLERLNRLLKSVSFEQLMTDEEKHTLAERRLERIVNRAIDVNFHLIRFFDESPPDDYTQSFLRLASLKILTPKLAKEIAPAAGARNVLVHEYDDLNAKMFYSSLKSAIRLFPQYVKAVEAFLEK